MRRFYTCFSAVLLSACSIVSPSRPAGFSEAQLPPVPQVRKGQSGGVFVTETPWSLTSDSRVRVGDVLTVMLEETTQASKKADTKFGKNDSVAVQPTIIAGRTLKTDVGIGAKSDFAGSATSTQQNALQGAITVIVYEVMPNGLLRVQGDKSLYLNQGEEIIHVSGYVRATDIDTDNRISSQRIANARISYAGQGTLADTNAPGLFMRFFASALSPF